MNSRLVFEHTSFRKRKLLGFLLNSLGTQLAWVIVCLLPGDQYNGQRLMLLLHGCWKSRQNTLPTKWHVLSSFLDSKKLTFGSLERTRVGLPITLHPWSQCTATPTDHLWVSPVSTQGEISCSYRKRTPFLPKAKGTLKYRVFPLPQISI